MKKQEFNMMHYHSRKYLEMALRTDKREIPEESDGYGTRTGECGDTVEMYIRVDGDRIRSVSINTQGCINTNACANTVACLAEGKKIDEAWEITPENVTDYLETLPEEEVHCAELAIGAFYLALTDYRELRKSPWKKVYRKAADGFNPA